MEILTFRVDRVGGDKTLHIEAQMDKIGRISVTDINRAIEQIIDQHFEGNPGPDGSPADGEGPGDLPDLASPLTAFSSHCSAIID